MNRILIACMLSLVILGLGWAQSADDGFLLYQVAFDGRSNVKPSIPKGWKLISAEHGTKVNDTNLWFQDESGSVFMVQGFRDTQSREFIVYHYVNEIEAEK